LNKIKKEIGIRLLENFSGNPDQLSFSNRKYVSNDAENILSKNSSIKLGERIVYNSIDLKIELLKLKEEEDLKKA
jgi:hypothetical protein